MRSLILLTAACGLISGCAAFLPQTVTDLAEAQADLVDETRVVVPLPISSAYRNTLAKARECWQMSAGWPITQTWFVEGDPFEKETGFARVAVRMKVIVTAVITLRPLGPDQTELVGRSVKVHGPGRHVGQRDLRLLREWATGERVECLDRMYI